MGRFWKGNPVFVWIGALLVQTIPITYYIMLQKVTQCIFIHQFLINLPTSNNWDTSWPICYMTISTRKIGQDLTRSLNIILFMISCCKKKNQTMCLHSSILDKFTTNKKPNITPPPGYPEVAFRFRFSPQAAFEARLYAPAFPQL